MYTYILKERKKRENRFQFDYSLFWQDAICSPDLITEHCGVLALLQHSAVLCLSGAYKHHCIYDQPTLDMEDNVTPPLAMNLHSATPIKSASQGNYLTYFASKILTTWWTDLTSYCVIFGKNIYLSLFNQKSLQRRLQSKINDPAPPKGFTI